MFDVSGGYPGVPVWLIYCRVDPYDNAALGTRDITLTIDALHTMVAMAQVQSHLSFLPFSTGSERQDKDGGRGIRRF